MIKGVIVTGVAHDENPLDAGEAMAALRLGVERRAPAQQQAQEQKRSSGDTAAHTHIERSSQTWGRQTSVSTALAMSCRLTHSRWLCTSCMPQKILGVGSPRWVRLEPSVPPRMADERGSSPARRIASCANSTGRMSYSSQ